MIVLASTLILIALAAALLLAPGRPAPSPPLEVAPPIDLASSQEPLARIRANGGANEATSVAPDIEHPRPMPGSHAGPARGGYYPVAFSCTDLRLARRRLGVRR